MSDAQRPRQTQPSWPPRDRSIPKMLIRNRVVTLERIETGDWTQRQIKRRPADICELTAVLSDGTRVTRKAIVSYREGERERLFEPMLRGEMTAAEAQALTQLIHRRCTALQRERGALQRELSCRVIYG